MKKSVLSLLFLACTVQPTLAMTDSGFDDLKFGALIGLNVLIGVLALICFLIPVAVLVDRMRKRQRQQAIMRVTANSRDRLSKQGLAHRVNS